MNQKLFIILWLTLLLLISCKPNQTTETAKTEATTKKDTASESEKTKLLDELEAQAGNLNRTIWQKPKIIIQRLGDLSDKTIADIGAGPYGYFSFQLASLAKKIIAIDIDPAAIQFMDSMRVEILPPELRDRLELRLALPHDPKLQPKEADVVLAVNIYAYIPGRINYLKNLKNGMSDEGRILIVDFKMRHLPIGPPQTEKVPLFQVERDLEEAGYRIISVDDKSLDYQYMLVAVKM